MRPTLKALFLTVGVVGGFGSGIASCSHGRRGDHCDRDSKAEAPATTTPAPPAAPAPPAEPAPAPAPEG